MRHLLLMLVPLTACTSGGTDLDAEPAIEPVTRVRRLSRREIDAALTDLVGETSGLAAAYLPADPRAPFDNVSELLEPSGAWVAGVDALSRAVSDRLLADPVRLGVLTGCTLGDDGCLETVVGSLVERGLRGTATDATRSQFLEMARQVEAGQGAERALASVVEALVADPEFLYRVEQVDPDTPTLADPATLASRMSFFLWGAPPDAALLAAARRGALSTPEGRREQAARMWADPRARQGMSQFHAAWLGYDVIRYIPDPVPEYMREAADRLVHGVLFDEERPWTDLMVGGDVWVNRFVAEGYGLTVPVTDEQWMKVDGEPVDRIGLLTSAAFGNVGATSADASPTRRGAFVLDRLLCDVVRRPPPEVNADTPPRLESSDCKIDRYAGYRADPGCASCHDTLDGIGFGLESMDASGVYRSYDYFRWTVEPNVDCPVETEGELPGLGSFEGHAGMSRVLVEHEIIQACMVEHLMQYAHGVSEPTEDVTPLVDAFAEAAWSMPALIEAVVSAESFAAAPGSAP